MIYTVKQAKGDKVNLLPGEFEFSSRLYQASLPIPLLKYQDWFLKVSANLQQRKNITNEFLINIKVTNSNIPYF